jgi:hypothetical protein
MRYELNNDGYISKVFFGCQSGSCIEYTGTIPTGYETLEAWEEAEEDKLGAWKIVNGNLVFDNAKYAELKELYKKQEEDNHLVTGKELNEIKDAIEILVDNTKERYKTDEAEGEVVLINDAQTSYANIKLTNIDPYSYNKIDLIVNGKNMLSNTAYTQTISGITFNQNNDRSITINGTSTEAIEYNIAGTSNNTGAFLCFKKGLNYYLSGLENQTVKMYYYDGTNRTQIYSGTGGAISFTDSDKLVTQIVLSIASGKKVDNVTIYPQLEYGDVATDYEMYKINTLSIDFSEYIEEGLFPSDTLYPGDTLYPAGTTINYILIANNSIIICVNDVEHTIEKKNISLFGGIDTIYTIQQTNLIVEYSTNVLDVTNLDFMKSKSTTSNKFKVKSDGSIEAYGGKFNGSIALEDNGGEWSNLTVENGDGSKVNDSKNSVRSNGINVVSKFDSSTYMFFYLNRGYPIIQINDSNGYLAMDTTYVTAETDDNYASNSWYNILKCIAPSKKELKKNIEPFSNGLEIIKGSDIYTYHFKEEQDEEKKHIGLIIGDGYKTPNAITSKKEDGIDLYAMVSLSWQAIKELNNKIEKLENKIKELEEK